MYRQEEPRSAIFAVQAVSESISPENGAVGGVERPVPPQDAVVVGASLVDVVVGASLVDVVGASVVVVGASVVVVGASVVVVGASVVVVVSAGVVVVVVGVTAHSHCTLAPPLRAILS